MPETNTAQTNLSILNVVILGVRPRNPFASCFFPGL
jgi:hypothetical protein